MVLPSVGQSCPEPLYAPRALVSSSASHDTQIADYLSADFLGIWMWLFLNLDVFSSLCLGSPQGWAGTWTLQQWVHSNWWRLSCLASSVWGLVMGSWCFSFVIWQLLSLDFDFSCLAKMSAAQHVENCTCIWGCSLVFFLNFVFCNFFEVLHSKVVSTSKDAPRANCSDHADIQGILLRSFRISGCSLGIQN